MGATVVSCGDAPPVLKFGEHVLDFMALTVERFVIIQRLLTVFSSRDARRRALLRQSVAEPVAIVAAVSDQGYGPWQAEEQDLGALVVTDLTGSEVEQDRLASLVTDGVQLGVQAALCPSQTTGKAPFCAKLAAVRWAFRCVALIMIRSGFLPAVASATKIRSNTPSRLQRTKRL